MTLRTCVVGLAILAAGLACGDAIKAQEQNSQETHVLTVRGRVLNDVTNEPVARALVSLHGMNAATFTDDHGQFEFNIQIGSNLANGEVVPRLGGGAFEVRKLGFIQSNRMAPHLASQFAKEPEVTVRILPEAKIVGHIEAPGSEGDVRIRCQLYRKERNEGREHWQSQQTFMSWVDGEFRFYGLQPGTYKLITHEQMDRDSPPQPGEQLFGYPPMYYPNTTDFSLASPIVVKAGETVRVNLAVARKAYFSVRIGIANMPAVRGLNVSVYPMGHPSPGWSLGYNPREGAIEGMLPDGNYTAEASTPGEGEMSGTANFSVKGKPSEGTTLTLVRDATISVNVHEEFQSAPSNFGESKGASEDGQTFVRHYENVNVSLVPLDELNTQRRRASSRSSEGSEGPVLNIADVWPGRYEVEVNAGSGYVASVQSGGRDLMRQPLVVGAGGETTSIEVALRDDGAQVDGMVEEEGVTGGATDSVSSRANMRFVYLVPMGEGGRPRLAPAWGGQFSFNQVAPGSYLVLAFDQQQHELPTGPGEALQRLTSKGQVVRLERGQHVSLRVKVIASEVE